MNLLIPLAVVLLACVLCELPGYAACPAIPNTVLAGTWTFQTEGLGISVGLISAGSIAKVAGTATLLRPSSEEDGLTPLFGSIASVGRFTATTDGLLNIVETTNSDFVSGITRDNVFFGTFQMNADCSGGILQFGTNSLFSGRVFAFFLANGNTELFMVNIDNVRFPVVVQGTAIRS